VKRKVRSSDTRVAGPDMAGQSSSVLLLSKTQVGNFNSIISGGQGYVTQERMSRLQDFNEMDAYAEINAALDIYADESVAQDAVGKTLHIHSDNPAIKKNLEELFYNTLNAEFNLRPWVRNLVKYGDFFLYIDVSPEYGVINVVPIPVNELTREEGFDPHDPLAVRFRWMTLGNRTLENWEVAHFRLMGNDQHLPYGSSMIDGARRIWRQLVLIEDAMLVYRVTRSPERRVFYIDVGGVAPDEIANYMEAAKTNIKSSQVMDRATGRVDLRYNPLSVEEDYWIPVRGTDTNTRIDTLQAGQNTGNVEDVQYIQKKLIAALKVPAAYLGYNDAIPGCLTEKATIPTVDGKIHTMKDLVEAYESNKPLPLVYSFDIEKNCLVPGKIVRAWETRRTAEIFRVVLKSSIDASESTVECTGNHPFLNTDGEYTRADQLQPSASIRSLYGRYHDGLHCKGYHQSLSNSQRWEYTHRLMADHKYGRVSGSEIVHHVDFDKLNNVPSNLMVIKDANTHRLLHAMYNRVNKTYAGSSNPGYNRNITFERLVEAARACSDMSQVCKQLKCSSRVPKRLAKEHGITWLQFVDAYMPLNKCAHNHEGHGVTLDDIINRMRSVERMDTSSTKLGEHFGMSSWAVQNMARNAGFKSWSDFRQSVVGHLDPAAVVASVARHGSITAAWRSEYRRTLGISKFQPFASKACKQAGLVVKSGAKQKHESLSGNHTVVRVERVLLEHPIPVYDLEIEKYHNFAVGSQLDAVYVHNSSGLAQVDVRFSRTVNMIQRTIVSELNKIAMVHMFAAGFRGDDLIDFEIRLSNPSTIAQQQKLELLRTRFEIAASAPPASPGSDKPLMSERWVQRNVMGLNDQEILQNKRERLDDVRAEGALEAAGVLNGASDDSGGSSPPPDESGEADDTATPPNEPGLETAADDNRGQGDLITSTALDGQDRVREGDAPVKLMPGTKKALYNRRRNLRRRTHGKVNVLDRAVSGATARPAMPEGRSMLQEAFSDVYDGDNELAEDNFSNDQSFILKQEAALAPTVTVKPVVGQAELRMMRELSVSKNLAKLEPNHWNDDQRRERVLLEHFAPGANVVEHDDAKEFELYDEEVDESTDD
jgi:hypothetical protein